MYVWSWKMWLKAGSSTYSRVLKIGSILKLIHGTLINTYYMPSTFLDICCNKVFFCFILFFLFFANPVFFRGSYVTLIQSMNLTFWLQIRSFDQTKPMKGISGTSAGISGKMLLLCRAS